MIKMKMPRADEATKAFFESILPDDPRVKVRPVFGNVAALVNGNMFSGVFGNDVFVRLPEGERTQILKEEDASPLEPMPGRPMKEYVVLPGAWRRESAKAQEWIIRSFGWASQMPEKRSKRAKKRGG